MRGEVLRQQNWLHELSATDVVHDHCDWRSDCVATEIK